MEHTIPCKLRTNANADHSFCECKCHKKECPNCNHDLSKLDQGGYCNHLYLNLDWYGDVCTCQCTKYLVKVMTVGELLDSDDDS